MDAARETEYLKEEEARPPQGVVPARHGATACTLLVAIVGDGWAAFAQIGDGVIAIFNGDAGYELAFWPDNGEYANATRFTGRRRLPQSACGSRSSIGKSSRHWLVMTDGLQMLALDFKGAWSTTGSSSRCFAYGP